MVLILKTLALQSRTLFVDPEGESVVLDLTFNNKTVRLTGIYAPCLSGKRNELYRRLEEFLVISKTIVILGYFNAILNTRLGIVGSPGRRYNPHLRDLDWQIDLDLKIRVFQCELGVILMNLSGLI